MTVAQQDHVWEQGEDLVVEIIYKINEEPVALSSASHAIRMDIAPASGGAPVFSFNSMDFDDPALDQTGEADNEIVFPADPAGTIHIVVPRSLTLPGGVIGDSFSNGDLYNYDMFIRDLNRGTQRKLLKGTIRVNKSITLWS